jgi:hypothetical protein
MFQLIGFSDWKPIEFRITNTIGLSLKPEVDIFLI